MTKKRKKTNGAATATAELGVSPIREIVLGDPRTSEGAVRRGGFYLSYGSNLLPRQMAQRVDGAKPVERVRIRDRRLAFGGGNNVATLQRERGSTAAGVLWYMPEKAFEVMDAYEGCPRKYRRKRIKVRGYNDLPVYTYLLRDGEEKGAKPYRDYYRRILDGLVQWGFDKEAGQLRRLSWAAKPKPTIRSDWTYDGGWNRIPVEPPREQIGVWPGDTKSYDFEDLGDGLDINIEAGQLLAEPEMFADFRTDGDQPYANYRSLLEVRAPASVDTVLGEYAAMQAREGASSEAFIGFFYGIFMSPDTRKGYGLGKQFCAAKLVNMRRVKGYRPAATEYAPGEYVNGVLCAVPTSSVQSLDSIEGAPEWYRRERVVIKQQASGGRYTKAWAGAQYYQMNRFDIGSREDLIFTA